MKINQTFHQMLFLEECHCVIKLLSPKYFTIHTVKLFFSVFCYIIAQPKVQAHHCSQEWPGTTADLPQFPKYLPLRRTFTQFLELPECLRQLSTSPGAQPALHFGEGIFMKFYSMTSSCLFNSGTTFSQTVTDKVIIATFPKMIPFQF